MINTAIAKLIRYAEDTNLIESEDRVWAVNALLEVLHRDSWKEPVLQDDEPISLSSVLYTLVNDAQDRGILQGGDVDSRDRMDTALMGRLTPPPREVISRFWSLYRQSPMKATDWFYQFSQDTNYIRRDRIARDVRWQTVTDYGPLDITINLSKPERDPKAIAAAARGARSKSSGYPKCTLCRENEGYAGRADHPARQNLRVIPLTLDGNTWYFQYSPYVYYNEHCVVFNQTHTPMAISHSTFKQMLDFVTQFPHYFLGSNADLPIVGGSILGHDHFQGGHYDFPIANTEIDTPLTFPGWDDVYAGILHWPISTIRLRCSDSVRLSALADHILTAWRNYTDEDACIFARTNATLHNTITPVARRRGQDYELDLVLRNNLTTERYPLGLYHPHPELYHIKRENIGVIEVMGLAVLPARLKRELSAVGEGLLSGADLRTNSLTASHADWAREIAVRYNLTPENVDDILKQETGMAFLRCLEQSGVFKRDKAGQDAFLRFLESVR